MLISPEYSEQLRLANVQTFDQALPVILAYEKTLKNSSAFARSGQPTDATPIPSVNAIQAPGMMNSDVTEIIRRNKEELDSIRNRFALFENLLHEISSVVKKKPNNYQSKQSSKWCSFHKSNSHSDAECRRQKNDSNPSNGSSNSNPNGSNRPNGYSGNGRNNGSNGNNSKN